MEAEVARSNRVAHPDFFFNISHNIDFFPLILYNRAVLIRTYQPKKEVEVYTIALLVVLGIVLGMYLGKKTPGAQITLGFWFGVAGGFIGLIIATVICPVGTPEWQTVSKTELFAMRSTDSTNGAFLLASGNITSRVKYIYYVRTPDGGYQSQSMIAENNGLVTVYPDSPSGGNLTVDGCVLKYDPWVANWAIVLVNDCGTRYSFHIPEGSLLQQYSIQ